MPTDRAFVLNIIPRPAVTPTFEPLRPLNAPDGGMSYAAPMVLGGWRVYYGEPWWPSRSYWIVPGTLAPAVHLRMETA